MLLQLAVQGAATNAEKFGGGFGVSVAVGLPEPGRGGLLGRNVLEAYGL
jgi:hypothetical protein